MRMINPVIPAPLLPPTPPPVAVALCATTFVSIDASYGLGEAVVGGMVTPDKLYVFQRDDGSEVVIRNMGYKDKKIVYDDKEGGTKLVMVSEEEAYRWALSWPRPRKWPGACAPSRSPTATASWIRNFASTNPTACGSSRPGLKPAGTKNWSATPTPFSCAAWKWRSGRRWSPKSSLKATARRAGPAKAWCAFALGPGTQ